MEGLQLEGLRLEGWLRLKRRVEMPSKSKAQARLIQAVAHGWKPKGRVKPPVPVATAREAVVAAFTASTDILAGQLDDTCPVLMNGATYMADLMGGQKTGLFYDQRPNHAFAARLAQGAKVLDVFTHVGGFALAALAGGAASALAVDASASALAT